MDSMPGKAHNATHRLNEANTERKMNALQQAQERHDNALPPGFFDDEDFDAITPEQADEAATDEFLANPAMVAASLVNMCGLDAPVDLREADELSVVDGNPNLLLAYAISGRNSDLRLMALNRLSEFIAANGADAIKERAAQILEGAQ